MILVEEQAGFETKYTNGMRRNAGKPFGFVSSPTALHQIRNPDTSLVVWQRSLAAELQADLSSLVLNEIDDLIFVSELTELEATLADGLNGAGYPDTPALRADIAMLARHHAAITGDREVKIRLEIIETDACRKFHTDYVKVRTIITYLGQGTQWIEADASEQAGLRGKPEVRQVAAGAVAVFKGRLWQNDPTVLHRSPPIGELNEKRLVLVIDPVSAEEDMLKG